MEVLAWCSAPSFPPCARSVVFPTPICIFPFFPAVWVNIREWDCGCAAFHNHRAGSLFSFPCFACIFEFQAFLFHFALFVLWCVLLLDFRPCLIRGRVLTLCHRFAFLRIVFMCLWTFRFPCGSVNIHFPRMVMDSCGFGSYLFVWSGVPLLVFLLCPTQFFTI